ncbi:hypothetical protein DPSP01_007004 [Paraphaeosphaeria sporulosa]|uniref:Rhodopsin domain-containing protein n=1 Tax=Paraphaeosphaeria sporulosa TaxID=1460663 RepID=A0A177CII0_9PLEO|nr:uncharacterized protein CC84DRAFT_1215708 [Paraphaeosphaeria sporulosa]OAG06668.1 hypothetical protein CC84DRAFT_1215708 [Paraphaeosphaeria sporulosa]
MAAVPNKPALHPLTSDDRGSLIIIIAYSWIFITVLAAGIRFGLAWSNRLHLKKDDGTFALGVVLAVASSVCFHIASNNGLGKKMAKVPLDDLDVYYKATYAGEILGLAAQYWAKASFLQLCERVAPRKQKHYNIVFGMVTFWGVFSILAIALQCGLPDPWVFNPEDCPTKGMMYYPVIIMNIITDLILGTWILPTLWKLLMDQDRRILVVMLFGSRIIVACVAAAQLNSVARHILDPDVTYQSFGRVLWALCVTHLSVLQSTIPRTKRFIAALNMRTHATVRLTAFELQLPTDPTTLTIPGKGLDTFDSSEATTSRPDEAHTRSRSPTRKRSDSDRRSSSHSPTRSMQSERPLVPLQLTPSAELYFKTEIVAQPDPAAKDAGRTSKKYDNKDWKKYIRRSRNEDDMALSSMFSWKSRTSTRIVQTKEVTQEVELVHQPKESRWNFRRQSEVSKRNSASGVGQVDGQGQGQS